MLPKKRAITMARGGSTEPGCSFSLSCPLLLAPRAVRLAQPHRIYICAGRVQEPQDASKGSKVAISKGRKRKKPSGAQTITIRESKAGGCEPCGSGGGNGAALLRPLVPGTVPLTHRVPKAPGAGHQSLGSRSWCLPSRSFWEGQAACKASGSFALGAPQLCMPLGPASRRRRAALRSPLTQAILISAGNQSQGRKTAGHGSAPTKARKQRVGAPVTRLRPCP